MLAWCKIEKGERAGFIFAGNVSGNGFSDAATKIDAEMADDRKQ
jgi:hypothetical protein